MVQLGIYSDGDSRAKGSNGKGDTMWEHTGDISREMETLKKEPKANVGDQKTP